MASFGNSGKVSPADMSAGTAMKYAAPDSNGKAEPVVLVNYNKSPKEGEPGLEVSVISGNQQHREIRSVQEGQEGQAGEGAQKEPSWYCRTIVKHPKKSFAITLALHLWMVLTTFILLQAGYDILPLSLASLPLDIRDDPDYLRGLAWQERTESDVIIDRNALAEANQSSRSVLYQKIELFFEKDGGNVFSKENLQLIKKVEDEFFYNEGYQKRYCQLDNNLNLTLRKCLKPSSVLRYFDGTYAPIDPVFYDPGFDNIVNVLFTADNNTLTKKRFQAFLGKTAVIDGTKATSEITFSALFLGLPLTGYHNDSDREDDQHSKVEDFLVDEVSDKGDHYYDKGVGDMHFFYYNPALLTVTIQTQVIRDLGLAIGSLVFIVLFMCFQTGSLWMTCWAIVSILCAFCTTNLIYRVVLDYRYLGVFHILAVFIILGIGADDVFVFVDTWKESAHRKYPSLEHRLSDVYRKSAAAMLYTSLTTAIAFIVSSTSPFLGVSTFGVFAGILVLVNYLSVVLFYPTVILTYHLYWQRYKCCCCCPRSALPEHEDQAPEKKNVVVRALAGPYFRIVTHKIGKWVLLVLLVGVFFTFLGYCTKLQVDEDQPQFLNENTNFGQYLVKRTTAFRPGNEDSVVKILLVWGMREQDLDSCHRTDPECYGRNVWDDNFNLNTQQAQQALLDLCADIRRLPASTLKGLHIRSDLVSGQPEVQCFLEEMATFLDEEEATGYYPNNTDFSMPTGQNDAVLIMNMTGAARDNSIVYTEAPMPADFNRYFEIVMSYWLYNAFSIRDTGDIGNTYLRYDEYLGDSSDPPYTASTELTEDYLYSYGTRLRYAAIIVNTTIQSAGLGFEEGLKIRNRWEDFVNEQKSAMPSPLRGGFQVSESADFNSNLWHWLKVQEKLVSSAVSGMGIGIICALPILTLATHNIIVGLLATGTIVVITICVVGLIPMAGWKLGLLESLNLVLVVGLSVDYVVHLAEGYSRSHHSDRQGRVKDTLEEVGISVLSGAITTLGASFFLIFAQIRFFTQFGYFMFGTIGFSIVFSLGLFVVVMGLIGPQNDFGSTKPVSRAVRSLFRKYCKCWKR